MFDRFLCVNAMIVLAFSVFAFQPIGNLSADEAGATKANEKESPTADAEPSRVKRIANYLSGAKFTGQFTVDGKPNAKPESYTISSCEPLEETDMYRLKVKIRYGDVDGEFPMDLKILWAGSTPVITLDAIWIPGLGTFSSRVLIHQNRYSGTWQHDEKGGQLFGTIEKSESEKPKSE